MAQKYVKKPVIVESMRFGIGTDELIKLQDWMDADLVIDFNEKDNPKLKIKTLEGVMEASVGDYIIKGIRGEFYPCKPDIFEATYSTVELDSMSFGMAVDKMKMGHMVARRGWNGKNLFVFMQVPATIGKDIVPKMQSLPPSVKAKFQERFDNAAAQIDAIYYDNQLAIVNESNLINGWSPSVSDALATDWYVAQ